MNFICKQVFPGRTHRMRIYESFLIRRFIRENSQVEWLKGENIKENTYVEIRDVISNLIENGAGTA